MINLNVLVSDMKKMKTNEQKQFIRIPKTYGLEFAFSITGDKRIKLSEYYPLIIKIKKLSGKWEIKFSAIDKVDLEKNNLYLEKFVDDDFSICFNRPNILDFIELSVLKDDYYLESFDELWEIIKIYDCGTSTKNALDDLNRKFNMDMKSMKEMFLKYRPDIMLK